MAAAASTDRDREIALSTRTNIALHAAIERLSPASACPPDVFAEVLRRSRDRLVEGLRVYKRPSAASEKKLRPEGGKITVAGRERSIGDAERNFVLRLSAAVDLDQWQAFTLLQSYLRDEHRVGTFVFDDVHIVRLADYYADERAAVLRCVSSLLRHAEDESHPYAASLDEAATSLTANAVLIDGVVAQLKDVSNSIRTLLGENGAPATAIATATEGSDAIPAALLIDRDRRLSWRLVEQAELLEILFIAFYSRARCDVTRFVEFAVLFQSACFGETRGLPNVTGGSLGGDAGVTLSPSLLSMARRCAHLCVLVLIECLGLEAVATALHSYPTAHAADIAAVMATAGHAFVGNADAVQLVDGALGRWGERPVHGPVLLAWGALRFVHAARFDQGDAESYRAFASQATTGGSNPLDYLAVDVLGGDAFGPDADSALAYRSVAKGLLTALGVAFQPDSVGLESCVGLAAAVYSGHPLLCAQFWNEEYPSPQLRALLDAAAECFPLKPRPLLSLLSALAADGDCALRSAEYSRNLHTVLVPLTPLVLSCAKRVPVQSDAQDSEQQHALVAMRPIIAYTCSPHRHTCVVIPAGALGQVVQSGSQQAVLWHMRWSAWSLFVPLLDDFIATASLDSSGRLVVSDPSNSLVSVDCIAAILELCAVLLERSATAASIIDAHVVNDVDGGAAALDDSQSRSSPRLHGLLPRMMRVLQRCVLARDLPAPLFTAALRCVGGSAHTRPYDVWSGLVRCGFLPAPGLGFLSPAAPPTSAGWFAGGAGAGALGSQGTVGSSGWGHMRHILHNVECARGSYSATLSFLGILSVLVGCAQMAVPAALIAGDDGLSMRTAFLRHFLSDLGSSISFVLGDVFVGYDSWRYQRVLDRYAIGLRCLSLFDAVLSGWRDPPSSAAAPPTATAGGAGPDADTGSALAHHLATCLASDPVLIAPLLRALGTGTARLEHLWLSRRVREARMVERLVLAASRIVCRLLDGRARLAVPGATGTTILAPTPLDVSLFHWTDTADGQRSLVFVVAEYVFYSRDPGLIVAGAGLVRRLCSASTLWHPRPPSMLGYIGEKDNALRNAYARRLLSKREDVDTKVAILRMIGVAVETQPGLAMRFLDLVAAPAVPSEKQKSGVSDAPPLIGNNSCLRLVVDVLGSHRREMEWRPRLFAAVMGLVRALWERRDMYGQAINAICRSPDFWKNVVLVACPPPVSDAGEDETQTGAAPPSDAVARAQRMVVRGFALHILATELFSSKADPAMLATVQRHLSAPGHVGKWLASCPVHAADPALLARVHSALERVSPVLSLEAFRNAEGLGDGTHLGPLYVYDAERLAHMLLGPTWRSRLREARDASGGLNYSVTLDSEMMVAEEDVTAAFEGPLSTSVAVSRAYGVDSAMDISRAESAAFGGLRPSDPSSIAFGDDVDASVVAGGAAVEAVALVMRANCEWSLSDASLFVVRAWRALFGVLALRRPSVLGVTVSAADATGKAPAASTTSSAPAVSADTGSSDRPGTASALYAALHAAVVGLEDCAGSLVTYASALAARELAAIVAQLCGRWLSCRDPQPTQSQLMSVIVRLVRALRASESGDAAAGNVDRPVHTTLLSLARRKKLAAEVPLGEQLQRQSGTGGDRAVDATDGVTQDEAFLSLVEHLGVCLGRSLAVFERGVGSEGDDNAADGAALCLVLLAETARHLQRVRSAWTSSIARDGVFGRVMNAAVVASGRGTPADGRFLEAALLFLTAACEFYGAADALAAAGLGDAACAVAGQLLTRSTDGTGDSAPAAYAVGPGLCGEERSVWHRAWCHVLALATAALSALGRNQRCLEWCVDLCALAGGRIAAALVVLDPGAETGIVGMSGDADSQGQGHLTLAAVEEARRATALLVALSRYAGAWRFTTPDVFDGLCRSVTCAVQRIAVILERPGMIKRIMRSPTRGERDDELGAQSGVAQALAEGSDARAAAHVERQLFVVMRNALVFVRALTPNPLRPSYGTDWGGVRPLFAPLTDRTPVGPPSIGSLLACLAVCESRLRGHHAQRTISKTRLAEADDEHVRTLLFIAENALVSVLSHATFYLSLPHADESLKVELKRGLQNELSPILEQACKFFHNTGGASAGAQSTPTSSPFGGRTPPLSPASAPGLPRQFARTQEQIVFVLADAYVRKVLR